MNDSGKYPVKSVQMMADICREAEATLDSHASMQFSHGLLSIAAPLSIVETVAHSAVVAANHLHAALIVVVTQTGVTAQILSKYRPRCPILTIISHERGARQCLAYRGLFPMLVGSMIGTSSLVHRALRAARHMGMCKTGDIVVVTSGTQDGKAGGTNTMNIQKVSI